MQMDNYRLGYRKYFPFKQYIEIENVMQEKWFWNCEVDIFTLQGWESVKLFAKWLKMCCVLSLMLCCCQNDKKYDALSKILMNIHFQTCFPQNLYRTTCIEYCFAILENW